MMFDVAIIGAGIAGASVAAELAPLMSVLLLEAEDQPGYHSTGRSNALWHETYGGPAVSPLTSASRAVFEDGGFLQRRKAITIAQSNDVSRVETFEAGFAGSGIALERLDRAQLETLVPGLTAGWDLGVLEVDCFDIDVAGLHASVLRQARRAGAQIVARARVSAVACGSAGWNIETTAGSFAASRIVNAAGGWADKIAHLAGVAPIGIVAYRRTITQLRLKREVDPDGPFLIDINGTIYFRPEGNNRVWVSPHDETAVEPSDVAPEEIDIATAIDRFQHVVDWPVAAVERSWAGLRSFAPDRLPVYGFDPQSTGFFWCAGQGGFGIQTAPAGAKLCAAQILGIAPDRSVAEIDPAPYAPGRFQ
jgi:D-arginine dehydrogenase